jgi:hypothetical protein
MSTEKDAEASVCVFCNKGRLIKHMEEMAFRQSSDKGYIHCRVTIEVAVCDRCGARSLDPAADAIFDEAFQREYNKLK